MPAFDWLGAATFGHWSFSGPSRVGYSLVQTLISCIILGILSWVIKVVLDTTAAVGAAGTTAAGASSEASNAGFSGTTMFFSAVFGFAAWIWTLSFSAACYEHLRGLEPADQSQKLAEGPKN
jgi:hypothetical protein